jgi:hypothetical protein
VPPLEFEFQEFLEEILAIKDVAKNFLERGGTNVLDALKSNLESIRSSSQRMNSQWSIPLHSPLKTRISQGEYEQEGRRGRHKVFGEITSTWIITSADKATHRRQPKTFKVTGKASVRIRLIEHNGEGVQELAMWRVELGDDVAPGCYFHIQVLGQDDRRPFPSSLSVPRLPALIFTPMAALEFVIAELFQDEWKRHVATATPAMKRWRSIQQKRFQSLFAWKYNLVSRSSGSPWVTIKAEKPESRLFLEQENLPRALS